MAGSADQLVEAGKRVWRSICVSKRVKEVTMHF